MKYLGYLVAAVVLTGLAVLVALHVRREALALEFANGLLAGSGIRVTELSIDALRADEIRFAEIVLESDDGAMYRLLDLHLPLSLPDTTIRGATIGLAIVTPAPADVSARDYVALLDLGLGIPARHPGIEVSIALVEWAGWPAIEDVVWRTEPGAQHLILRSVNLQVRAAVTTLAAARYSANLMVDAGTPALPLVAALALAREASAYQVKGTLDVDLPSSTTWLRDRLPAGVGPVSGAGVAALDVTVEASDFRLSADVRFETPVQGTWTSPASAGTGAAASGIDSIRVEYGLAEGDWSLVTGTFKASGRHPSIAKAEADVSGLSCAPAGCTLDATLAVEGAQLGETRVEAIDVTAQVAVDAEAGWRLLTLTPTSVHASGIEGGDWRIADLRLHDARGLVLHTDVLATDILAERLTMDIADFRMTDTLRGSLRLQIEDLQASLAPLRLRSGFDVPLDSLRVAWQEQAIVPAGLRGRIDFSEDRGTGKLQVLDPDRSLDARFSLSLRPGHIRVAIDQATIGFDAAPLSHSLAAWPFPWDVIAGSAAAEGQLEWRDSGEGGALSAVLAISVDNAAATWKQLAATGIQATVPLRLPPNEQAQILDALVNVELLDIGLPVNDLVAGFSWDMSDPALQIQRLEAGLLGGRVSAEPFDVDVGPMKTALRLRVDAIQLGLIPELAEFEALEVTGALSGMIPLSISEGTVKVNGGRLDNDPPGGVIRYRAAASSDSASGLAFAQRALSNLQYESLSSDVNYTEAGDLLLAMRLKGTNPDMDPLQPVILNLSIENNIPQLLRSLQATRDIEDVIESKTQREPGLPQ